MLYLEKLTLYLRVARQDVFVDPICLINEFPMSLSRLNSFNFYLSSVNNHNDLVRYLSNNEIKRNYMNIGDEEVSNIACFSGDTGTYHVFTLPFKFAKLMSIGNRFPNVIFKHVIELWVHDVIPFEHEFFLRIARAFPLLKIFFIFDFSSMSYNAKISVDNIRSDKIVKYPHLTVLDIMRTDINLVDQFLNENKTHLPCLTQLSVRYEDLRVTTEDFTRKATRRNCANVTRLITGKQIVGSKEYHIHFPSL